ncbi:syntaxin-23-like [Humulus lupulus]|uniref:syntaxin-23-like n=1 Tax=Humulus lupulus TaxID=3486 RepID=UPI002B40140E|nr:syntaxin-23-like [Humulus lupulus]
MSFQGVAQIFQLNTSVAAFHRLVAAKDTPDHRRKLHESRQRMLQIVKDTTAQLKSLTQSDEIHHHHVNQSWKEVVYMYGEIALNEALIEEREQDMKEIQFQIKETNEIFKDLAVLVHDQGIVFEEVNTNLDSASVATTEADSQLAKAWIEKGKCFTFCLVLKVLVFLCNDPWFSSALSEGF